MAEKSPLVLKKTSLITYLLQEEQKYRAEKVIESMSSEQERIKNLERYNAELKAEFCILQKQNTLMKAEFEQKLNEMSVDFKVKIKNQNTRI